ncbi:hypothetical protein Gasu2_09860 [Galdieria sulphuraria]|uniref:Uncharacterized protein n=1 Tax=Galdieria sulphuraria TaxID=130081 RepID=M2Y6F1_GALSU|nr:uncharacterized protein Gasu_13850 [Galdieria sulphuraria]EME31424.1 hypothetical protein Gasu_13850 [Galdieria sulphuraria]GJD06578.1 hypothetical protein Gasu2_09860 [Galdieria sulphuraria]|eukprot:XP_005707944.1 hypothetical protein Gasu_13850 [Galdieria sulphuraria]
MSINGSFKESFNNRERYFYPIGWLLQNRNVHVLPGYERELEECKLLHKTVTSVLETLTGKGERQKRTTNDEPIEERPDGKLRESVETDRFIGNDKFVGTKASDGTTQDRSVERKPKQEVATNTTRSHNERNKRRGSSGRAETFSSAAPQLQKIPPGFEKLGLRTEEKLDRHAEKAHFAGHLSERTKEGVFQSTFLEKGGRFAKGPDENVSFQRPHSLLLKEWNQTEVPESMSFLVDLSRTYFIRENVRKVMENVLAVVQRNSACSDSTKERNGNISETETPKLKTTANNVTFELSTEPLISNSSEVTVEDEDIERIVLTPGLLMNLPYDHSISTSSSVKQSRVTKWTEELDEPASQEQTILPNSQHSQRTAPVELEKNIDSFLASVRKRTLSKKTNMHHATGGRVLHCDNEAQPHTYSESSDALLSQSSPVMEGNFQQQNGWNDRNNDFSKTWKRAIAPPIALIDPAICDAKIKTPSNSIGVESAGSTQDAKYHSPVWNRPIGTNNGVHQHTDSSHLLLNLLGGGQGHSNSISRCQKDSSLEQNMKMYPSSLVHTTSQIAHRKKAVYAEDLEQALIAQTLKSSQKDGDSSMSLLKDGIEHLEGSFM